METEIIDKLIGDCNLSPINLLKSTTDEKEIRYINLYISLLEKSNDEKFNLLQLTEDYNEEILIVTSIIDDFVDEIDDLRSILLPKYKKHLKKIMEINDSRIKQIVS
jgi:hypothetical protein